MDDYTTGTRDKVSWLESWGVESRFMRNVIRFIWWFMLVPLLLLGTFRLTAVTYVDNYQVGYKFDARSGETTILDRTGYFVNWPFVVSVHHVDLRPMQVCISAIQRVLNCKLVQFKRDQEALRLFLSWHGRQDYDGPDTSGSNQHDSNGPAYTYFQSVLLNYAFDGSGKDYPFLTVLRELKPDEKSAK